MSKNENFKIKIQHLGSYLSGMVMPNIGAFIAWGLITALFIPTGWFPNETFAELVDPMIKYLLPILIGYTGGKMVYGTRGAVVAAVVTLGLITGSSIPMFLGAMIMGPVSALIMKKIDAFIDGKIPAGFEMLVNNFSAGILSALLVIIALIGVGPLVEQMNIFMATGVDFLIGHKMLPLASIFVEPAKVLFLNNAINHGVLGPLAIDQVAEFGKSALFLVEANPGPGLGILLAYSIFGKGEAKQTAPGAVIIHFLGGIHEIYFPYILMKPQLLISAILGGMSGIFTLNIFNAGLVASPSPGSILAILPLTERGSFMGVILSVVIATIVSFVVSSLILKRSKTTDEAVSLKSASAQVQAAKQEANFNFTPKSVTKVIFACDAGMGSSAMGASILKKRLADEGITLSVANSAIAQLPQEGEVIVTHKDLKERVLEKRDDAKIFTVSNFLGKDEYDAVVQYIKEN